MHKMHKFCEYYNFLNHRMTWNHNWIQSWTTWKRPYVKKQFEKFFIFFMNISIHDSLSIHFKITWKSFFSLCTWTLFLGIQTSTCCLSIFWKTSYSVAITKCCNLIIACFCKSWHWYLMAEFEEEKTVSPHRCLPLSNWEEGENLPVVTNQRHNVHWCQHFPCKDIPTVHYSLARLFHGLYKTQWNTPSFFMLALSAL